MTWESRLMVGDRTVKIKGLILCHTWGIAGENICSFIDYICSNISYN